MSRQLRRRPRKLLAVALAFIFAATLTPLPGGGGAFHWWCLTCGRWVQDGFQNVLLFVPLGLALGGRGSSVIRAGIVAALLSCGIEVAQHFVIPGRDTALWDVIANAAGGGLGAAAWHARIWRPAVATSRRLWPVGAVILGGVLAVGEIGLQPPVRAYPELRVRRRPGEDEAVRQGFRLLEARWNGRPFEWDVDPSRGSDIRAPGFVLSMRGVVLQDAPRGFVTVGLYDDQRRVVAEIEVRRRLVRGRLAQRGEWWGLTSPDAVARLPAPLRAGDTIDVAVSRLADGWEVTASAGQVRVAGRRVIGAREGWRLLAPELPLDGGPVAALIGVTWLVLPAVATGAWASYSRRAVAAAIVATITVPLLLHWLAGDPWGQPQVPAILLTVSVLAGTSLVLRRVWWRQAERRPTRAEVADVSGR